MKRITRRQARSWLNPMRSCLQSIHDTGMAPDIDGRPVTRTHGGDDYVHIDACCAGFRGLIERLLPWLDSAPLLAVEKRLEAGELMTAAEIQEAMRMLRQVEDALMDRTAAEVRSAVLTEQIAIEMDEMQEAA